jgi:lysophospholipase L1-like esterase
MTKRKCIRIIVIVAVAVSIAAVVLLNYSGFDPRSWPSPLGWMPFEAVQVRTGLPLTRQKLEEGSPVVVGFIGGSITQNAEPDGFVAALRNHWRTKYPDSSISTLNAGMAGTDSAWGAKRIDRDLLEKNPDVVFVEFAVNDDNRDSSPDMERIVRKIHHSNKNTEIVFIYTTSDTAFRKLSKKKVPHAIREHEEVAEHYGIPSIVLGSDLYANIQSGKFNWEHFFHDACHPKAAGYGSYSRDFLAATDRLLSSGQLGDRDFPHPIAENFELYPPKRKPAAATASMERGSNKQEDGMPPERMPTIGSEWMDDPTFQSASGSIWKLEYAVLPSLPGESEPAGLEARWLPARWFEEAGGFTGQRSRLIAEKAGSSGNRLKVATFLTGGSVEVPQLLWKPYKAGDYLVELSASKIQGHVNGRPALAGFELFTTNANEGLIKEAAVSAGDGESLQFRKMLRLANAQELVVRPFARGYESLEFEDLQLTVRLAESIPVP